MTTPAGQTGGATGEGNRGGETSGTDDTNTKLERVTKNRDSILKEKRASDARVVELEALLEERDGEKEKASGELSKVNERLERKIEKLTKERDDARSENTKHVARGRQDALVERVSQKTGVTNRGLLRALIREAATSAGFDAAPEDLDDDLVDEAVAEIVRLSPDTFKPSRGSPSPVPGMSRGIKPETELPETADWKQRIVADQKAAWGDSAKQ